MPAPTSGNGWSVAIAPPTKIPPTPAKARWSSHVPWVTKTQLCLHFGYKLNAVSAPSASGLVERSEAVRKAAVGTHFFRAL